MGVKGEKRGTGYSEGSTSGNRRAAPDSRGSRGKDNGRLISFRREQSVFASIQRFNEFPVDITEER